MAWDSSLMTVYEATKSNDARFVLGSIGTNPLVCFGINPSKATPSTPDPTLRIIANLARAPFDSYLMFNLYPQRSTNPQGLHDVPDVGLKSENERVIGHLVAGRELQVYAAWGTNIELRPYLSIALRDILQMPAMSRCNWTRRSKTVAGHPHHPLGVAREQLFDSFDIEFYVGSLFPQPEPEVERAALGERLVDRGHSAEVASHTVVAVKAEGTE